MKRFNPNDRVQTYAPMHEFLNLLSRETEEEIEEGKYDSIIIDSPTSRNQKNIKKKLPDPVERLLILTITAKYMTDNSRTDERNILFTLARIPQFLFPNFTQDNISLYSQADFEEVSSFLKNFSANLPQHSPRFDNRITILLKIEFYVNAYLYFCKSMIEKRFPYGKDYYDFISFLIHEFYTILKPQITEIEREVQQTLNIMKNFLDYTTVVYFFEHFPEQVSKIFFFLNNMKNLNFTQEEIDLISELVEGSILVNKQAKNRFIAKVKQ
jgi:hypothetical protein